MRERVREGELWKIYVGRCERTSEGRVSSRQNVREEVRDELF